MADLEELIIRIKADTAALERGMRNAQNVVEQSGRGMSGALRNVSEQAKALLPALSVGAVAAFAKSAFQAADRLNDLSQRTGVAATTLSALNIPLLQSGSNVEEFSASINRMNNLVGEAAKGLNQEAIRAFDDLGLSVLKLQQLSPEEQFYQIAQALGSMSSQSQMTNAGMAIFGRSFSSLIPIIKESKGNLRDFTDEIKANGGALTEEQLKKIDDFGDRWTKAVESLKLTMANALPAIQIYFDGLAGIANLPANAYSAGQELGRIISGKNPRVSYEKPQTVDEVRFLPSARGNNAGILKDPAADRAAEKLKQAKQALADYNRELNRQHEFAGMAPRDAAAMKAYYDTLDAAQKAGVKNAEALATANAEVARSTYDMQEVMQEATRFNAELKDQFASTAKSIVFDSKNAGDAVKRLAQSIAEMYIQKKLLGPLADNLFGSPSGGGGGFLGNLFGGFFADGGTPPINRPSVVGENGPEIFVPKVAGTVVPNGGMGGQSVNVSNTFNIGGGVTRQELASLIPVIQARTEAGVFAAIERGGKAARIVGRKS